MAGFKLTQPALMLADQKITPDEMDAYGVYYVINPSISASWVGTRKSGTADVKGITFNSVILDYPRNLEYAITGSSVGMAGTIAVTGRDQFGVAIAESCGFGSADNGGTVVGTKVFAHVTTGTVTFGTFAGANGTATIGVGTSGTTCVFGLPVKLGGTQDVKILTYSTGTQSKAINGGTVGGFVDATLHGIKSPTNLTGTETYMVWYRSSYDPSGPNARVSVQANLPHRS